MSIHDYVNGRMNVNAWQDGAMQEEPETRFIEDVATLRALAEPTRLAILSTLLKPPSPRIMSVKELAAELGMSPTRLYRHVRQLEETRLVKVAETRMVSGILEQRYQASGQDVRFRADFLQRHPDESMAAFHVLIDEFARGFLKAKDHAASHDDADAEAFKPVMVAADVIIAPEAAAELARRLRELNDWLHEQPAAPDGTPVTVMFGFYRD
jgi:DNA-binding transcriptional ArsR family regulator